METSTHRAHREAVAVIIVDSSTWAGYFNGSDDQWTLRLESALEREEELAVLPIIVTEVLQGFRTQHGFEQARRVLTALPAIHPSMEVHVDAALLFRFLREKGVTVRGAVDCVIARTCIEAEAELLSSDADFRHIARYSKLRLWNPESS